MVLHDCLVASSGSERVSRELFKEKRDGESLIGVYIRKESEEWENLHHRERLNIARYFMFLSDIEGYITYLDKCL